ncbi:Glutathione S-transferase domain protein [Methylocella tundrae]|uniref:Glutathione S-transferase domain protein n=1 Tax=Methylocella tundrae TaxID=227605 RepID=A0A8B6MC70_METTU|nr:glutathione S-transferase N-terminal domain-containing protein [Methylocella tundrae]VTZ24539.1 Glutathione S-transferase domain protein [Methylocella tundrae]VTZ52145.1 Glutathione S-transferase domain protein [Methylocella tundrae]
MMILRTSAPSPFGRKVRLAAAIAGLSEKIRIVTTDANDPDRGLFDHNPLGKIPVLTLPGGEAYFDSRVIVEYFDHLAGGDALIPAESGARFHALTLAALADGVLDASLLQVYEKRRREPAKQDEKWLAWQADKAARGLAAFAGAPPSGKRDVAHIGLACVLGYLDLRFEGRWRSAHPELAAWLADFTADVPAFAATRAQ